MLATVSDLFIANWWAIYLVCEGRLLNIHPTPKLNWIHFDEKSAQIEYATEILLRNWRRHSVDFIRVENALKVFQ